MELDSSYEKGWVRLGLALKLEKYQEAKVAYSKALEKTDKTTSYDRWKMCKKKIDECEKNIK